MKNKNGVEPCFAIQVHDGNLLFILTNTSKISLRRPGKPLWHFRLTLEEDFEDVVVWLGERHDLWPRWYRVAARDGRRALSEHVGRLLSVDPIEQAQAVIIARNRHPLEVSLEVRLVTRTAEIGSHRFADADGLAAFMAFMTDTGPPASGWTQIVATDLCDRTRSDSVAYAWALVQAACLAPAGALSQLIGEIVDGSVKRGPAARIDPSGEEI